MSGTGLSLTLQPWAKISQRLGVALLLRSFGWWGDGDEVFDEALAVVVEQFVDALEAWGADDQARMMSLLNAIDDLLVHVGGRVRLLLFGE